MTKADWWTLDEAADFASGGTPSKADPAFWSGDIQWVPAKDVKSLRIHDAEDRLTAAGLEAGSRLAPRGSTLVLVRGMNFLNDVPICMADRDVAFNQNAMAQTALLTGHQPEITGLAGVLTRNKTGSATQLSVRPEPVEGLFARWEGFDKLSPNGKIASVSSRTPSTAPGPGMLMTRTNGVFNDAEFA